MLIYLSSNPFSLYWLFITVIKTDLAEFNSNSFVLIKQLYIFNIIKIRRLL